MESAETMESAQQAMPPNVAFADGGRAVRIVDQTMLPGDVVLRDLSGAAECHEAIAGLLVRGAPTIGVFAAFALSMLARGMATGRKSAYAPERLARFSFVAPSQVAAGFCSTEKSGRDEHIVSGSRLEAGDRALRYGGFASPEFLVELQQVAGYLESSRPTAVNLHWALDRMMKAARQLEGKPLEAALDELQREAESIALHEAETCDRISEFGLGLLEDGMGIITHCNAGPLATCGHGTALGPILLGAESGMQFKVYADETRPLLQGARLTSYELAAAGVDVTLICDNMASIVMKQGWVQACLVGCDRVAANGDAANKIGTSGLAIIAKHYGVPFYVMCPTSTIDYTCESGEQIPIELRDGDEIKAMWYERPMAPADVPCYNPSFDVTDHSLIAAIVTERGICRPPYTESLAAIRG